MLLAFTAAHRREGVGCLLWLFFVGVDLSFVGASGAADTTSGSTGFITLEEG